MNLLFTVVSPAKALHTSASCSLGTFRNNLDGEIPLERPKVISLEINRWSLTNVVGLNDANTADLILAMVATMPTPSVGER